MAHYYQITGIVRYKTFCVCGYCEGHSRRLLVNDLAIAEDNKTALKRLLDGHFGDDRFNTPDDEQPLVEITELNQETFKLLKEDFVWVWGW